MAPDQTGSVQAAPTCQTTERFIRSQKGARATSNKLKVWTREQVKSESRLTSRKDECSQDSCAPSPQVLVIVSARNIVCMHLRYISKSCQHDAQRLLKDTSGPPAKHHSLAGVFEKPLDCTVAFYSITAFSLQSFWRNWHCYMFGLWSNQAKCWAFIFLE